MFRNYQLLINYQNSYIFFRKIKKMKLGREKIRKKIHIPSLYARPGKKVDSVTLPLKVSAYRTRMS